MTAKRIRTRIVTGCLMMMLPLATVVFAQNRSEAGFDLRAALIVGDAPRVSSDQTEPPLCAMPAAPPVVSDMTDGTSSLSLTNAAPPAARPETEPVELSKVQVPGTVQNLRRVDKQ